LEALGIFFERASSNGQTSFEKGEDYQSSSQWQKEIQRSQREAAKKKFCARWE